MPTLYLSNGKALSRTAGSLLFGDCRCPTCCPRFGYDIGTGGIYFIGPAFSNVELIVRLMQWEWTGAAYQQTIDSVDQTGLGSDSRTVSLLSFRKNTPCGVSPSACAADINARFGSWAGSVAGSGGTLLGAHRGGRHVTVRIGVRSDYDNAEDTDQAFDIPAIVNTAECNECAKYHITEGSVLVSSRSEPGTIVHSRSAVILPGTTQTDILADARTLTAPAHSSGSCGAWWEWDLYLDAQYDQGLIV